jgi:2-C-methyl-D-erythritol 4-phosphate cytidylyltransferase
MRRATLVIPAAGSGARFGSELPKQFLDLGGISVLARSLRAFAGLVAEAVISGADLHRSHLERSIRDSAVDFPVHLVAGGETRMQSVAAGISRAAGEVVLVHDAVRPLVPRSCVVACLEALERSDCVLVAVPCASTVKRVLAGVVQETVDRRELYLAQTPQGFQRELGRHAYAQALAAGWPCSDDAQVLERSGHQPLVVAGDACNFKITTPDDLLLARALLGPG